MVLTSLWCFFACSAFLMLLVSSLWFISLRYIADANGCLVQWQRVHLCLILTACGFVIKCWVSDISMRHASSCLILETSQPWRSHRGKSNFFLEWNDGLISSWTEMTAWKFFGVYNQSFCHETYQTGWNLLNVASSAHTSFCCWCHGDTGPWLMQSTEFRNCVEVKVAVLGSPSWWALWFLWT